MSRGQKSRSTQRGFNLVELLVALIVIAGIITAIVSWTFFEGRLIPNILPPGLATKFTFLNLVLAGASLLAVGGLVQVIRRRFEDNASMVIALVTGIAFGVGALYFYFDLVEVRNVLFTTLIFLSAAIASGAVTYLWLADLFFIVLAIVWFIAMWSIAFVLIAKIIHLLYGITF